MVAAKKRKKKVAFAAAQCKLMITHHMIFTAWNQDNAKLTSQPGTRPGNSAAVTKLTLVSRLHCVIKLGRINRRLSHSICCGDGQVKLVRALISVQWRAGAKLAALLVYCELVRWRVSGGRTQGIGHGSEGTAILIRCRHLQEKRHDLRRGRSTGAKQPVRHKDFRKHNVNIPGRNLRKESLYVP